MTNEIQIIMRHPFQMKVKAKTKKKKESNVRVFKIAW